MVKGGKHVIERIEWGYLLAVGIAVVDVRCCCRM